MMGSICRISEIEEWCKNNNSPGFSVVDRGSACSLGYIGSKDGVRDNKMPGLGVYFYDEDENDYGLVSAWAVNEAGLESLRLISSKCFEKVIETDHKKNTVPVIHIDDLLALKKGVLFGSGCYESHIAKALINDDAALAETWFDKYKTYFNSNFIIELGAFDKFHYNVKNSQYVIPTSSAIPDSNLQKALNKLLYQKSKESNTEMGKEIGILCI
jgi:DNA polymerase III alpha subunit